MKINRLLITCIAGAILSSCGLMGPSYQKPQVTTPTNWSSTDNLTQLESANLGQIAWWKKFNDPMLNQLISQALAQNNNLQIAIGNVLQAKAALSQVNMNWVPTVPIGAAGFAGQVFNSSFTNNSGNPGLNYNSNNQSFDGYGAGFIPSYSLNIFNQIKQTEIAKLNLEMQKQSVNALKLAVISQVSASYFNLLGLHQQLLIQQQLLADAEELRKYTQLKYQHGSINSDGVDALDQYIANAQAKIPEIENNITQVENALQVLINHNPGKVGLKNNFEQIKTTDIVPINLPSAVLQNRPDIAVAEYQLKIANGNIGVVTSMFFPSISLTGMLGQGSLQLSNLFSAGGNIWAGEIAATMPFLNLGLYSQIDQAKAQYYSAYFNYLQTTQNAFAQVDNALASHNNADRVANQQKVSLNKSLALYTTTQKQYLKGAVSYADTLGLKINVDYERAKLNQSKIQQLNSIVNLYQALAGGYMAESNLTQVKKIGRSYDLE